MRLTAWCVAERGGAAAVEKAWSLLSGREIVQFVSRPRKSDYLDELRAAV